MDLLRVTGMQVLDNMPNPYRFKLSGNKYLVLRPPASALTRSQSNIILFDHLRKMTGDAAHLSDLLILATISP